MRFLLALVVAAWSLVVATAQTSQFPNINVRTNATVGGSLLVNSATFTNTPTVNGVPVLTNAAAGSGNWSAIGSTNSLLSGNATIGGALNTMSVLSNRVVLNEGTGIFGQTNRGVNYARSSAVALTLYGGGNDYPNKIGVTNWIPVVDLTEDTNFWINLGWYDTGATDSMDVTTISGGYDHLNNQIAGTIAGGGHNELRVGGETTSGHGVIGGGARNKILSGDYETIAGGRLNVITNSDNASIGGGAYNAILDSQSTWGSGFSNIFRASAFSAGFGRLNYATNSPQSFMSGESDLVSGSSYATAAGYLQKVYSSLGATSLGYNNVTSNSSGGVTLGRDGFNAANFGGVIWGQGNSIPAANSPTDFVGDYSGVSGNFAVSRGYGARNHSSYRFSSSGDAQYGTYLLGRSMNVAGPSSSTELRLNASSAFINVPTNSVWTCTALINAASSDGTLWAAWKMEFVATKGAAGAISFPATTTTRLAVSSNNATNWLIAPYSRALTSDNFLGLRATSEAGVTVKWHARLDTCELQWGP